MENMSFGSVLTALTLITSQVVFAKVAKRIPSKKHQRFKLLNGCANAWSSTFQPRNTAKNVPNQNTGNVSLVKQLTNHSNQYAGNAQNKRSLNARIAIYTSSEMVIARNASVRFAKWNLKFVPRISLAASARIVTNSNVAISVLR